jgi:lipid-A-disaccharide synthase-like uncharacterized protein
MTRLLARRFIRGLGMLAWVLTYKWTICSVLVGGFALGAWAAEGTVDAHDAGLPMMWLAFGFAAQAMFTARLLVQWLASEKAKDSVVPPSFWWLSMIGGTALGIYFLRRGDPVGLLGQMFGTLIYARNLWLLANGRRPHAATRVDRPAVDEQPARAMAKADVADQVGVKPTGREVVGDEQPAL